MAEVAKAELEKTPLVKVTVKSAEWATYKQQWNKKQMAAFFLGWYPDYVDPDDYTAAFAQTDASNGEGIFFSNKDWDALFVKEEQTTDRGAPAALREGPERRGPTRFPARRFSRAPYTSYPEERDGREDRRAADFPLRPAHRSRNSDRTEAAHYSRAPMRGPGLMRGIDETRPELSREEAPAEHPHGVRACSPWSSWFCRVMPGDPVSAMLGGHAPESVIEQKKKELGLNKPIGAQYVDYLGQLLRGDLGKSMIFEEQSRAHHRKTPRHARADVLRPPRLPRDRHPPRRASIARRRTGHDFGIGLYANVVYCIPVFWMGLLLQLVFGVFLGWFPVAGRTGSAPQVSDFDTTGLYIIDTIIHGNIAASRGRMFHLVLPAVTLGIVLSGIFVRLTRANMLDVLKSRLHPRRAGARDSREAGRVQPRPQERPHPHRDDARSPVQRSPGGRDPHREHLLLARHGPAPPGADLPPRLPHHPGGHRRVHPPRELDVAPGGPPVRGHRPAGPNIRSPNE